MSAIAIACAKYANDSTHDLDDRIAVCALWSIVTAGFSLLFRVGELARGAEFTPARHWTIEDLRPLERLKPGTNHCVRQPQRKVPGEHAQEAMPISFWAHPECFAFAARAKLQLHGTKAKADQDFFSIDSKGSSPTPGWVGGRLKAIMRALFPGAAQGMDFSDHTLRRGGATCLSVMNLDPAIQEHAGGFAPNSKCRPRYIARIRGVLAQAQHDMFRQRYEIMQDDIGFSIKESATTEQPKPALNAMGEAMRPWDETLDEDMEDEDGAIAEALTSDDAHSGRPIDWVDPKQPSILDTFKRTEPEPQMPRAPPPESYQQVKDSEAAHGPPQKKQKKELIVHDPLELLVLKPGSQQTAFDRTPEDEICREFQFGGYHPFDLCSKTHICSFCRKGSHGCARCPVGGKTRIAQFKQNYEQQMEAMVMEADKSELSI